MQFARIVGRRRIRRNIFVNPAVVERLRINAIPPVWLASRESMPPGHLSSWPLYTIASEQLNTFPIRVIS